MGVTRKTIELAYMFLKNLQMDQSFFHSDLITWQHKCIEITVLVAPFHFALLFLGFVFPVLKISVLKLMCCIASFYYAKPFRR